MTDREKVIKELSWLIYNFPWKEDPKDDADRMCNAIHTYCKDALALLKEQEAVRPSVGYGYYLCGVCKQPLQGASRKFCPECGRKVKWDD